ncbi:MAG TPA: GNAT family N-acetyltransferase [Chthoniobacterales bacterium]|nr:GNAT family N-acetyltransferase [Chthoniobacterales bacterium]
MAELSGMLGYPAKIEAIEARLKRMIEHDEHVVFVAEKAPDEVVVGWIHAAEQEILEAGCLCEIKGLVVAEGERGRGAGRHLIEAVERWALARGLDEVSVRSNVVRVESHLFYERMGYARFKTQHAYRKRLALPDS